MVAIDPVNRRQPAEQGIRLAVVDDHPIARYGVERIFADVPRFEIVASVGSVDELAAYQGPLDVVILDLYLDRGRTPAHVIAGLVAHVAVLVMSQSAVPADVLAAVRAGAAGYLVKRAAAEEYVTAVQTVVAGGFHVSSQLADIIHADVGSRPPTATLAPREREVLQHIAEGFTQAQTARLMHLSPGTVDTYLKRIRRKLGPGNKADLTRRALGLDQTGQ